MHTSRVFKFIPKLPLLPFPIVFNLHPEFELFLQSHVYIYIYIQMSGVSLLVRPLMPGLVFLQIPVVDELSSGFNIVCKVL